MKWWIKQYVVALLVLCLMDLIWLTLIAHDLYDARLGDLLADEPNVAAAMAFYLLFVAGLVHFVIHPAVSVGSWKQALLSGGFFGLVTYAAWDLTNLAVLDGFPAGLVVIDLAWGTFLAASVSLATYAIDGRVHGLPRKDDPGA